MILICFSFPVGACHYCEECLYVVINTNIGVIITTYIIITIRNTAASDGTYKSAVMSSLALPLMSSPLGPQGNCYSCGSIMGCNFYAYDLFQ